MFGLPLLGLHLPLQHNWLRQAQSRAGDKGLGTSQSELTPKRCYQGPVCGQEHCAAPP